MLSLSEIEEIRNVVHAEMVMIESEARKSHGSYHYLCFYEGTPIWAHTRVGPVIREFV